MQMKKGIAFILGITMFSALLGGCGKKAPVIPELAEPVSADMDTTVVARGNLEDKKFYKGYAVPRVHVVSTTVAGKVESVQGYVGKKVNKGDVLLSYSNEDLREQMEETERQAAFLEQQEEYEQQLLRIEASNCQTQAEVEEMDARIQAENERYELKQQVLTDEKVRLQEALNDADLKAPCEGIVLNSLSVYEPDQSSMPDYVGKNDALFLVAENEVSYISLPDFTESQWDDAMEAVLIRDGEEIALTKVSYEQEYLDMMEKRKKTAGLSADLPCLFQVAEGEMKEFAESGREYVIKITQIQKEDVLYTTADSIFNDGNRTYVKRQAEKGTEKVFVTVGSKNSYYCEISAGVQEGDILQCKSLYFDGGSSRMVEIAPTHFYVEKEYTHVFEKWDNRIPVKCPYDNARLIDYNTSGTVKAGDVVATFRIEEDAVQKKELENSRNTLRRDCDRQIRDWNKEIEQLKKDRTEIEKENKNDAMLYSIDSQIRYLTVQTEKLQLETEYEIAETDRKLAQLEKRTGVVEVVSPVDGVLSSREIEISDDVLTKGSLVGYISENKSLLWSVQNAGDLSYMQDMEVTAVIDGETRIFPAKALITENILPPEMDSYYRFANCSQLMPVDLETSEMLASTDADSIMVKTVLYDVENCYVLDSSMVRKEGNRTYVYLWEDGVRVKQFITLAGSQNGKAYVLDGLSPEMGTLTVIVD